ncbi:serine/threonine protein kinase, partial [Micromonospora purpureochromogenes]|uniref:PsbP-related protein n=1 Tax=Micromonospora purpureochromogenes TaxID=47872 RepID=UPI00334AA265
DLHTPTGAMPSAGRPPGTTYGGAPEATQRFNTGHPDATQRIGGHPDVTQRIGGGRSDATQRIGGHPDATQPVYGGGQWSVPGTGQSWTSPTTAPAGATGGGALDKVRGTGGKLVATVQGWPRKLQLAAAGGLAVVLLIGMIAMFGGGDEKPTTPQQAQPSTPAAAGPLPQMQEHSGKGIRVLVPKGWERKSAGDWVDYVDPQDSGRKVRILAEKWSGTPARWAEVAETGLRTRSKSCVKPYEQIAMTEPELAGQPAAELEYTCGDGEAKRHGVWRGVVHDGKVYSFYLSATDTKFAESKPIFDEMVKSFQLTAAG